MHSRLFKLVRGGAGIALLAGGMGIVGSLGIGLASSGVASAAGPTVSGTWACQTPLGTKHVETKIQDQNTIPASMAKTTTYTNHVEAHFVVPASLIHLIPATITELTAAAATMGVAKVGFTGPSSLALSGPVAIPITTTTRLHGATVTFTYSPATFTQSQTSGTSTIHATTLSLVIAVPLHCFPPGVTIVYTVATTFTNFHTTGSTTQGPIDSTTATPFVGPLSLAPAGLPTATGTLPAGQATVHYSQPNYWTSSGGKGTNVWTETGTLDGLIFSGSGNHASLAGTPTAAGTFPFSVTVTTKTGTHVTHTYTVTFAAAPSTPTILQPFSLTVIGGSLTMTCVGPLPVETQATAKTCTLINLDQGTPSHPFKLDEQNVPISKKMNTLYISTARGGPTDDWTLNAVMVPTKYTLTGNHYCDTVQGFCNVTTTTAAKLATIHTYQNTTILPNYLGLHTYTCKPQQTPLSPYYNVNPTPTTTPGRTPTTTAHHYGLSNTMTLCTAAAGVSGGEFIVKTGTYTLVVPPNIYAGKYYGTVQYTLVASV